jgi:5'-deoxynucleotidase YfbR-like HD superfamily hydrolase
MRDNGTFVTSISHSLRLRKHRQVYAPATNIYASGIAAKDTPMAKQPPRAWQRMLSGRRLDLLDPTPVDIEIEDIAHGLAFVARWNGQTKGDFAYSVAEHSLLVTEIFTRQNPNAQTKWQLAALLHDAPEYVIGDMISPVKAAVGPGYGSLDDRLTAAIHLRFGLPAQIPVAVKKQIKKADKLSAWLEAVQIAGFTQTEADKFFGKQDLALTQQLTIRLRPPVIVRDDFTAQYRALAALL